MFVHRTTLNHFLQLKNVIISLVVYEQRHGFNRRMKRVEAVKNLIEIVYQISFSGFCCIVNHRIQILDFQVHVFVT